jgi:N-acylglucosamine-6-phosphate 2-epimerase
MTDRSGSALDALRGGLVVSSQAMDPRSPLQDPHLLSLLAQAAALGGAAGFRVDGPDVVADLRPTTSLPIIGIRKDRSSGTDTYITPTVADALGLLAVGTDIVAAQATAGSRPAESFAAIAEAVHAAGGLVMADVSTAAEGLQAAADGADVVATTMAGYTRASTGADRPALDIVRALVDEIDVPVIVEGGVWSPADVRRAFDAGAWAVVVGSAVTAPDLITARFVSALPARR